MTVFGLIIVSIIASTPIVVILRKSNRANMHNKLFKLGGLLLTAGAVLLIQTKIDDTYITYLGVLLFLIGLLIGVIAILGNNS
jgi:hypothetical protein